MHQSAKSAVSGSYGKLLSQHADAAWTNWMSTTAPGYQDLRSFLKADRCDELKCRAAAVLLAPDIRTLALGHQHLRDGQLRRNYFAELLSDHPLELRLRSVEGNVFLVEYISACVSEVLDSAEKGGQNRRIACRVYLQCLLGLVAQLGQFGGNMAFQQYFCLALNPDDEIRCLGHPSLVRLFTSPGIADKWKFRADFQLQCPYVRRPPYPVAHLDLVTLYADIVQSILTCGVAYPPDLLARQRAYLADHGHPLGFHWE